MKIKILISPTMKMKEDDKYFSYKQLPIFLDDTQILLDHLQSLNYEELKSIWKCSDKLAKMNDERITHMDLNKNLTPAILSFQGLQYQYIAAQVFTDKEFDYLEEHLRILSGFYGVLKPFDGITPYRLEMKSKFKDWKYDTLYNFWEDKLSKRILLESNCILNLASKEYSQSITKYLDNETQVINCTFGELIDGKVKQKATFAKMARGEMIRFMAENKIKNVERIKQFEGLNYIYSEKLSDETNFIFLKKESLKI